MLANMVRETTTNPGTSTTISLNGAATGFLGFLSAFASGTVVYWFLDDGTQWECGYGAVTSGSPNTLARTTVLANSAGTTARLNFTGSTRVYNHIPAERAVYLGTGGALLGATAYGLGQPAWGGTAGGTANARTLTLAPALAAYAAGTRIGFLNGAAANADGAFTLNVNGLGTRSVVLPDGSTNPPGGLLAAGAYVEVMDDGTSFRLLKPAAEGWFLISSQAGTSVAQLDFTLPSAELVYQIRFELVGASDAFLLLRTDTAGGASFDTGGSDYSRAYVGNSGASSTAAAAGSLSSVPLSDTADAGSFVGGVAEFFPGGTGLFPLLHTVQSFGTSPAGDPFSFNSGGRRLADGPINAIRLAWDTGNLAAGGRASLYGMRRA